ncbi:unnamed protein product [Linum trigynum]|uniref:Uncharacterized protein n=1 Tax=Linum trigynum TaxID=586398 RepID=A0AAV2CEM7_9ROSI
MFTSRDFLPELKKRKWKRSSDANGESHKFYHHLHFCCNEQGFSRRSPNNPKRPERLYESQMEAIPIPERRRNELRLGCEAHVKFSWDYDLNVFYICEFDGHHNRDLHAKDHRHLLITNRKISASQANVIQDYADAGVKLKSSYEVMVRNWWRAHKSWFHKR